MSLAGFHHANVNWSTSTTILFKGDLPKAIPSLDNPEIFLIPEDPFFKDIDALYLKVDVKKKTALVVPIQVTLAKTHKDSETAFYSRWSDWQTRFEGYKLETKFVWVLEDKQSCTMKGATIRITRA